MKRLPLNLMTLYADLAQNVTSDTVLPATISRRLEGGKRRIYARLRDGAQIKQVYLGTAGDPAAEQSAEAYKRAAVDAKVRRKSVTTLKRAGVPSPPLDVGRLLEVMSNARLFDLGFVAVGTLAFQLYAPVVGAILSGGSRMTQDADFALARFAIPRLVEAEDLNRVLQRADATYKPRWHVDDKLPRAFTSELGFIVELLTTSGRTSGPAQIKGLGCAAQPLPYLEYLIEDPIETVALYGTGVRVKVPDPARFAVHKLIVHALRKGAKSEKDLAQARELIEVLRARDPDALEMAIEDAVRRGKAWRAFVRNGLAKIAVADGVATTAPAARKGRPPPHAADDRKSIRAPRRPKGVR